MRIDIYSHCRVSLAFCWCPFELLEREKKLAKRKFERKTLYIKKITTIFSALQSDSQDNPRLHNNKRHPISTFLPATCTTKVIKVVVWTSVVASKC